MTDRIVRRSSNKDKKSAELREEILPILFGLDLGISERYLTPIRVDADRTRLMAALRQWLQKKNFIDCPEKVDHYKAILPARLRRHGVDILCMPNHARPSATTQHPAYLHSLGRMQPYSFCQQALICYGQAANGTLNLDRKLKGVK